MSKENEGKIKKAIADVKRKINKAVVAGAVGVVVGGGAGYVAGNSEQDKQEDQKELIVKETKAQMLADLVERIDKDPTLENITLGDISQAYHGHQFSRKHAKDLGLKDPGELSFMGYIESAKEYTEGREIVSRREIAEGMELFGYKVRKDYRVLGKNQKEETNKGGKNESVKTVQWILEEKH